MVSDNASSSQLNAAAPASTAASASSSQTQQPFSFQYLASAQDATESNRNASSPGKSASSSKSTLTTKAVMAKLQETSNEIAENTRVAEAQQELSKQHAEKLDTCYELLQKLQITLDNVAVQASPSPSHPQVPEALPSSDSDRRNNVVPCKPNKGFEPLDLAVKWPTLGVDANTDAKNANLFLDWLKMCMLVKGCDFDEAGPRAILANIDIQRKFAFIAHCDGQLPATWKEACEKFLEIDPLTVTPNDALSRIRILEMDIYQPFSRFVSEFEWLREIAQLDPKDSATYDLFVKCLCGPLANMALGIIQTKLEKGVDHIEKLYKSVRFAENEFYMLVKDDPNYSSWVKSYNASLENRTRTSYYHRATESKSSLKYRHW